MHTIDHAMARLTAADTHFQTVALAAHDRGQGYTPEVHRARADVFAAAYDALEALDPRLAAWRRTGLTTQLLGQLLTFTGSPLATQLAADEGTFGVAWVDAGRPTFVVTAGLMAELLLTDPGKLTEADVAWPFEAFRIVLPNPDCGIEFTDVDGVSRVRMATIHVLAWNGTDTRDVGSMQALVAAQTLGDFQAALHGVSVGNLPDPSRMIRAYAGDGLSVFRDQLWCGAAPVSDWIKDGVCANDDPLLQSTHALMDLDRHALRMAQRVAVNLALYLSSEDERVVGPVWTPATKGEGKDKRTWTIGRAVKIDKEVREAATEVAAGGTKREGTKVRFIVRGHFRNQACGVGRLDRKRIYIKPHWHGPVGAEAADRKYEVT